MTKANHKQLDLDYPASEGWRIPLQRETDKLDPMAVVEVVSIDGEHTEVAHAKKIGWRWANICRYRLLKPVVRRKAGSAPSPAPEVEQPKTVRDLKVGDWIKRTIDLFHPALKGGTLYRIANGCQVDSCFIRVWDGKKSRTYAFDLSYGAVPTAEEIAEAERLEALAKHPPEHHPFHHMTLAA